jgi:hypothetical protein
MSSTPPAFRSRARGTKALVLAFALLPIATPLLACGAPTEVTLELTTNACGPTYRGASISMGHPGRVDLDKVVAATATCAAEGGTIGSLVVIPGSSSTEPFEVEVVAGLGIDPKACPAAGYVGCIVARRIASFVSSSPYVLPIFLDTACEGIACDATTTCVAGACVGAQVAPGRCEADGGCLLGDASAPSDATPETEADASHPEAAPPVEAAPPPVEAAPPPPTTASCLDTCNKDDGLEVGRFATCVCDPMLCSTECGAGPTCYDAVAMNNGSLAAACADCVAAHASQCDNPPCKPNQMKMGPGGGCEAIAMCAAACAP